MKCLFYSVILSSLLFYRQDRIRYAYIQDRVRYAYIQDRVRYINNDLIPHLVASRSLAIECRPQSTLYMKRNSRSFKVSHLMIFERVTVR